MNRIQLKNIKHAAFASEETHCYEASLYFDGKRVATVRNEGHGGCDWQDIIDNEGWANLLDYVKTLPEIVTDFADHENPEKKFTYKQDVESICGNLVNEWLTTKDLKRALSKKVLFQKVGNGAVFETKTARNKATLNHWIEQVAARDDTAEVLNTLPIDKALEIYQSI